MKNNYNQLHPASKLGVVALVCLLSFFAILIVASVIAIPFFGLESFTSFAGSAGEISEKNVAFLKYLQMVQSIGLFIVPSIVIAIIFEQPVGDFLKLNRVPYWQSVVLAILIIFISNPLINFTGDFNSKLSLPGAFYRIENWMRSTEENAAQITQLFLKASSFGGLLFNLLLIALIPAIGEEFLFRGIIQKIFREWTKNDHTAIWLTAILFSALHFQFYGFIPRAILGAMFGYLFVISRNLWLPVIAHFVNNAAAVIAYYLYNEGVMKVDPEKIGADTKYQFAAILSVILLVVMYKLFIKCENDRDQKFMVD